MEGLRYVYFGDVIGKPDHKGVATIGYAYDPVDKKMKYSVAFCNQKDRFLKSEAHKRIIARMEGGAVFVAGFDIIDDVAPKYEDTIKDIIDQFQDCLTRPIMVKVKDKKTRKYLRKPNGDFVMEKAYFFCKIRVPSWAKNIIKPR